jgi:hypothetical protein
VGECGVGEYKHLSYKKNIYLIKKKSTTKQTTSKQTKRERSGAYMAVTYLGRSQIYPYFRGIFLTRCEMLIENLRLVRGMAVLFCMRPFFYRVTFLRFTAP